MEQINQCMECGESISNPICPECIAKQAIARIADKQISRKLKEWEIEKINKKLALIIKANYADEGVNCISCKEAFAICPHCVARYFSNLPRKLSYIFSLFLRITFF